MALYGINNSQYLTSHMSMSSNISPSSSEPHISSIGKPSSTKLLSKLKGTQIICQTLFVQLVNKKLKLPYTAKSEANNALKLSIIEEECECPSEKVTHKQLQWWSDYW